MGQHKQNFTPNGKNEAQVVFEDAYFTKELFKKNNILAIIPDGTMAQVLFKSGQAIVFEKGVEEMKNIVEGNK